LKILQQARNKWRGTRSLFQFKRSICAIDYEVDWLSHWRHVSLACCLL